MIMQTHLLVYMYVRTRYYVYDILHPTGEKHYEILYAGEQN